MSSWDNSTDLRGGSDTLKRINVPTDADRASARLKLAAAALDQPDPGGALAEVLDMLDLREAS